MFQNMINPISEKIISKFKSIPNSNSTKRKVKCIVEIQTKRNTYYSSGYNKSILKLHNFECDINLKREVNGDMCVNPCNNPYTLHAESVAFRRLTEYLVDPINILSINIYCTTAPCVECVKEMILSLQDLIFCYDTKVKLFYGDKKDTFDSVHPNTNENKLIPKVVLESVGIEIIQSNKLKIENLI